MDASVEVWECECETVYVWDHKRVQECKCTAD